MVFALLRLMPLPPFPPVAPTGALGAPSAPLAPCTEAPPSTLMVNPVCVPSPYPLGGFCGIVAGPEQVTRVPGAGVPAPAAGVHAACARDAGHSSASVVSATTATARSPVRNA